MTAKADTRNAVLRALSKGCVTREAIHRCACKRLRVRSAFRASSRWIDMHVSELRRLGYDIETVRGVGYRLA